MFKLKSNFKPAGDQPQAIKKLVAGIKKGDQYQTLLGVTGSGKTFCVSKIISQFNMPVLVIAPNKILAAQLFREYTNFFPNNSVNYFVSYYDYYQPEAYLPITDTYISKEAMINEEIDRLRHQATSALLSRRDVIVVASVSCIYNLGVPLNYLEAALHIEKNKPMTRGDLIRQLVRIHFKRTNADLRRGYFRVRGDRFELMPASGKIINYIEIKDQNIKAIAVLDKVTRKRKQTLDELVIFPPQHFVSTQPQRDEAIKSIFAELKERLNYFEKKGLLLEAERLERRTRYDLEMIKTIGYCHGIENYSRHLSGKLAGEPPDALLSYFLHKKARINADQDADKRGYQRKSASNQRKSALKPKFLTIIDESHIAVPQIRGMYEGDRARKQVLIQYGWRLPSALDNRPLKFNEFLERINSVIFTSATPGPFEFKHSSSVVEQIIRPTGLVDPPIEIRPVWDKTTNTTQADDIVKELQGVVSHNQRAIINTLTKKMAEDFSDYLNKQGFKVNYMHSDTKTLERAKILTDFRRGIFDVLVGVNLLREGLDLPEVTLVAILDADREGFLRSESSLIQTMGRCARNVKGKVILYGSEVTGSMKRAIDEVERRRKKQLAYNKKHNIIPKSIIKKVETLIDIENEE
ncbi:DEAD/DEAH box helicase family protein [Patescibacteria group bacterium AH-259-L07]|nr:DEAD/DEAH box helicase family protein [Patescibacteria group bacterium AH-259-L07]